MPSEVVIIAGVIVLLIALFLLKKITSAVKCLLALVVLIIGCVGYVIFVPSSEISIWATENVASIIKLDAEEKYEVGDVIFTYDFNPTEKEDEDAEADDMLSSSLQNVTGTVNKLLVDRIEAIASKYIEMQEEYSLSFSDSYLLMTPGELSMKIEIFKGALPED